MSAITGCMHFSQRILLGEMDPVMQSFNHYHWDRIHSWSDGHVFMSCHAQWVTPESIQEDLPFYEEESGLAITADAILDNRLELFGKLDVPYDVRKRITDSELILLAYEKWGEHAPKHLIGDFTFMIWDEKKERLFGARDVSGHRTFYYIQDAERFAFCSMISPLFKLPSFHKQLNEQWMAEFLAINGMFESYDIHATAYQNVKQIPPAHSITVSARGMVSINRYEQLDQVQPLILNSDEEYEEAFREVFEEAVSSRLRTFKQVGAALSGGLDSGTVASFASPLLGRQGKTLQAYSYIPVSGFVDWTSNRLIADETPYIRSTVEHIGNIQEHYMDFAGKSPLSEVNEWLSLVEMPYKFFDNSFWIRGFYEQAQKDDVGVLLTGARGNFTISWGPALEYYAQLLRKGHLFHLAKELQLYSRQAEVPRSKLLPMIGSKAFPSIQTHFHKKKERPVLPELIHPDFAEKMQIYSGSNRYITNTNTNLVDAVQARQEKFSNLSIANKNGATATKLSLRYGLLERDPTSDPRVVRFCLSVPLEQYVQKGRDRALLRRSMATRLPDKVRLNQSVRGIQPADWIQRIRPQWGEFRSELVKLSKDSSVSNYLNTAQIEKGIAKIKEPRPEMAWDPEVRLLMHSLIVYRFLNQF
ncbi:asparagine synthase-related protein [Paenibacillus sp. Marseille-Q4541]|uniref:asparagine synthase-related protein n=1 Tax=Paenibacillus sp. Marseille-Q4541 TaxID=2831522 RepID=UPI001BA88F7E|nr:asparagine synthase-related protein [Paenibacillus sp. Marseille-Q4541]